MTSSAQKRAQFTRRLDAMWQVLADMSGEVAELESAAVGITPRFQRRSVSYSDGEHRLRMSEREREMVQYLSEGCTNDEAAERMTLSKWTVKTMLTNVMKRNGMHNRTQLVAVAVRAHAIP